MVCWSHTRAMPIGASGIDGGDEGEDGGGEGAGPESVLVEQEAEGPDAHQYIERPLRNGSLKPCGGVPQEFQQERGHPEVSRRRASARVRGSPRC